MLITVNGKVVEESSHAVSALDRGLLLGDGVFDTVRIYSGKAFRLGLHIQRLADASRRTGIELPRDLESLLLTEIQRAAEQGLHDGFLRTTLTRGSGLGLGAQPHVPTVITVLDRLPVLPSAWYSDGIRVVTAEGRRNEMSQSSGLKTTAYLDSILAFRAAAQAHAEDAIFQDTHDHLSEGTASNLFLIADEAAWTPPVECGALPGITRAAVVEIATTLGVPVVSDRALLPILLESSSEIFLTSSVREIVPVVQCDGRAVADGKPGPITREIMNAYAEMTRCR
jgi:branched-chain amino acid aminotransferase